MKMKFEKFLRRYFPHKEIGWNEIGETFTRYALLKTRWFSVYLHQLDAPNWAPKCHDHPWGFVALLLWPGYWERVGGYPLGTPDTFWRRPGSLLYRPATFTHSVKTLGTSWSLVLAGPKSRKWGFKPCKRVA